MHYPEHINLQKVDNGNTPLHVAAACNRLDVVDFLASQVLYEYTVHTRLNVHRAHCSLEFVGSFFAYYISAW